MASIAETVRAENATELERLGSDRGLIALTDADLSAETIRQRYAAATAAVGSTYSEWARDGEVAFETPAETMDAIVADLGGAGDTEVTTLSTTLAELSGTPERLGGGLIGVPLVLDGWALQAVSFFVNEADEAGADQFRSVRSDLDDLLAASESALEDRPEADSETAAEAATTVVDAAYEEYVATLESMGLEPKTVC